MNKRKIINYLLSFIIPILLFLLVMYLRVGVIDGNYILISDMEAQYNSLFQYLKNVLNGTESLFYSFNKGLGGEMFTTFTYYLSSPLNMLVFFFEDGQIPNCILLIILIKLGLSGLNMNIYLTHKNPDKLGINIIFSLCYALMSYTINYYFNIMWLDAVYMLPLITLGLEKLIDKNKPLLYIISLSYTIIANYYTGYMICLFSLLYFIYKMIIQNKKDKRTIIIFIISSILSAGISSFILIPTIIQLPQLASTQGDISIKGDYLIEVISGIFENMLIGNHSYENASNQYGSYLYIGVFCYLLVFLYFKDKKIKRKEKVLSLLMIVILILSFLLKPLNYVFHGFSVPFYLNNRNSFLLCFFLILIAHREYNNINYLKYKELRNLIIFAVSFLFLEVLICSTSTFSNIAITFVFLILYIVLLYCIKNSEQNNQYKIILITIIILELVCNTYFSFVSKSTVSYSYKDYKENICSLLTDNSYEYRTENSINKNAIDGLDCGYSTTTMFLSTLTKDDIEIFNRYGYLSTDKTYYNQIGNTKIMDSLLGIKYYMLPEGIGKSKKLKENNKCVLYRKYDISIGKTQSYKYCMYENEDSLKLGYIVDDIKTKISDNSFENQNELLKTMTGIEEKFLYKLEANMQDKNTFIVPNNNQNFYIYISSNNISIKDELKIYIEDEEIMKEIADINLANNILEIASDKEISKMTIKSDNNIVDNVDFYQVDNDAANKLMNELNNQQIKIKVDNDVLEGTFIAEDNEYLLITIPYDNNFELYIDDKKYEIKKAFGYFMTTEIKKGKHSFRLVYNQRKYIVSLSLSFVFIILSIFFVKKCKK